MKDDKLTFSVDSLLLSELGERLVTKPYVALAELIKNSYDADSTIVKVIFSQTKEGPREKAEIRITDNGHGMTFNQIRDSWMVVATPDKIRSPISARFGRPKTGNKGIGRFACRRLGQKLVLESISKHEHSKKLEYTKVEFDWKEFEPGRLLNEVPSFYERQLISEGRIGLSLTITGLNDLLMQRDFNVLRRQVLGLSVVTGIKRKGFEEDRGFDVVFEAPEYEMGTGRLAEQVMDAGWGRLRCIVQADGIAVVKLEAMTIGKVEYELPDVFSLIPGVSYDIAVIWRDKEYCRDRSIFTLSIFDEIFAQYGGVRVYLDGFRVYPYGDPGDDWLDIDKDVARRLTKADDVFLRVSSNLAGVEHSRAMLHHPRNMNLLGRVLITSSPKRIFEVTMSREGLVQNEAFEQLRKLIRSGLQWATIYYGHFLYRSLQEEVEREAENLRSTTAEFSKEINTKLTGQQSSLPIVSTALNYLEKSVEATTSGGTELPAEKRDELKQHAKEAKRVVEESVSHLEKQVDLLRSIASSGALMLTFVHEARSLVGTLDTHANTLEKLSEKLGENEKRDFIVLARKLRVTRDRFDNQIKLFHGISRDLRLAKRRRVNIRNIVDEVTDAFSGIAERFGITIEADVAGSLRTGSMLDSEAYSILINLISNSVKAVIASDEGNKIRIEATQEQSGTVLRVYDDGIGISKDSRNLVGQPLVADPEGRLYKRLREKMGYDDLLIVGEGSGMGLSIVKDILAYYGKTFKFVDIESPWKTCVEVSLP